MTDESNETFTHVIVMTLSPGYWGKGETVKEAVRKSEWIERGDRVRVVDCGPTARIDELGGIVRKQGEPYRTRGKGTVIRGGEVKLDE